MCVCVIKPDESRGPKEYLVQNHHAFTIWSEIQRVIFYMLHFQSTYLKVYI